MPSVWHLIGVFAAGILPVMAQLSIEVPGGWGSIVLREGKEPADEVELFSQASRAATGHQFSLLELQAFVDTFCRELSSNGAACGKPLLGPPLSVELGTVGTIHVKEGQFPGEAIDEFLVSAKARGVQGLSQDGVAQVLDYFCARKPCFEASLRPVELQVQGVGTLSVAVGEDVADAVERFAYAAREAGHALTLEGVGQMASRLCTLKKCTRPATLPPTRLEVRGFGAVVVPFGVEPADAVEEFVAQVSASAGGGDSSLLPQENVDQIMSSLCAKTKCFKQLKPVSLAVEGFGTVSVSVGQDPADAARLFLDQALSTAGVSDIGPEGAEALMRALCKLKRCTRALDLAPSTLEVQGVGTIAVPLGADPTKALEDWLESARGAGHSLTASDAAGLMNQLCSPSGSARQGQGGGPQGRGLGLRCTRPLDTSPLTLNVSMSGAGLQWPLLEVPFGAEPADATAQYLESALAAGRSTGATSTADAGTAIMEALCARKKCHKPLDVSPLSLNVPPLGVLSVPFGVEPALVVTSFLLEARAAGHVVDAQGATQLMESLCAQRNCHVPLDVSGYGVDIQGVGRFVVPFGQEPSAALTRWVQGQVVPAMSQVQGQGRRVGEALVNAQAAAQIMADVCANVTCFVPLDVSPINVEVEGVGTVFVSFGSDPTSAVSDFLLQALQAGHAVTPEFGGRLMEAVCSAGQSRSLGSGAEPAQYCHRPLDMTPFSLDVTGVGRLLVPWGSAPNLAVARFADEALDAGHAFGKGAVEMLMERACAHAHATAASTASESELLCRSTIDTNATVLNVTGLGVLEVEFGADVAASVRAFASHCVYHGLTVTVGDLERIMQNLCSRTKCRKPLDLNPVQIPVQGVGTLAVPFTAVPQQAVRAFGNAHRLSPHAMQQVLNALCEKVPCEAESSL